VSTKTCLTGQDVILHKSVVWYPTQQIGMVDRWWFEPMIDNLSLVI